MALVVEDRVMESSTTTGTGNFALGGAYTGYRAFDDVMANGDTCYYVIEALDDNGNPAGAWECGLGTFNDTDTLVRTTVHRSSNAHAAVNFGAGNKRVILDATATYLGTLGGGGDENIVDANWFNVKDYGAVGDGSTDDTDAIQDAIDACEAAGGGTVYFPKGKYKVNGALQDTSRSNSQLLLPRRDALDTEQITVVLRGEMPPPTGFSVVGTVATNPDNHSIILGTLNTGSGTTPSLLGGWGPSGSFEDFTYLHLVIRDLAFRMPSNPVLTALNLSHVTEVELDNVVVDCGFYAVADLTEPTTNTSFGICLPAINNGANTVLGTVNVIGFYTGYWVNEHTIGRNVNAWGCKRGYETKAANYPSVFTHLGAYHCQKVFYCTGGVHNIRANVSIEHASSGTWAPVYDLDDASGYLRGEIIWHSVLAGTGPHDVFTYNGGSADLRLEQAGRPAGRVVTLTGTAHTASLAEKDAFVRFTNGSAITFTLPSDASVNFPVGSQIEVSQEGAGALSFAAGSGATVNSRGPDLTLAGQYSVAFAKKVASNTWTVNGDM